MGRSRKPVPQETRPAYMHNDEWEVLQLIRAKQQQEYERNRRQYRRENIRGAITILSGLVFLGAMSWGASALGHWLALPSSVRTPFAVAGIAYLIHWFAKPRTSTKD